MVQKHIHDRDLMNFAHEFVLLLNQVMPVKSLYIPLLKYIIVAGDSNNYKGFLEVVKEQSVSEYRGDTMTIAQRLENEGFEKGVRKVAFEMLADGVEFRFVEKYTGISEEQLRNLQK
jgi:predicted transposase/invertase (TIGR01784 family)